MCVYSQHQRSTACLIPTYFLQHVSLYSRLSPYPCHRGPGGFGIIPSSSTCSSSDSAFVSSAFVCSRLMRLQPCCCLLVGSTFLASFAASVIAQFALVFQGSSELITLAFPSNSDLVDRRSFAFFVDSGQKMISIFEQSVL